MFRWYTRTLTNLGWWDKLHPHPSPNWSTNMPGKPIRRVITGHSDRNVAKVVNDGPATNIRHPREGVSTTLIWSTDETPADVGIGEAIADAGALVLRTQPPASGSRFTV